MLEGNFQGYGYLERGILKLLYLDFDGVLHDSEVVFRPRQGVLATTPNRSLFEWMPIIDELLSPYPDVRIVLSTSWVRIRSFKYAKSKLSQRLQSKVIGATFHHGHMDSKAFANMPRGVQVANDVFRRGPQSWFAIDDDDFGWPLWCRDNLIRTTGTCGISAPEIRLAIEIMLARF